MVTSSLRFVLVAVSLVAVGCGGGTQGAPAPVESPAGTDPGTPPSSPPPDSTGTPSAPSAPAPGTAAATRAHRRCGWIGADTWDAGRASFLAHPDYYDAVHPFWITLNEDGSARLLPHADDAEVVAAARAHQVALMPLIYFEDAEILRRALATPAGLQAHAQMLADLVRTHGWDGIELDYEHLWSASDRAPYSALVAAVAALLHRDGKVLSLAVPALAAPNPQSGYDYAALQEHADILHLMGYDYHYLGGPHLGPLAPRGWIDHVLSHVESLGAADKYILGIANYGIGANFYTSAKEAAARCLDGVQETTDHMATCDLGHEDAGSAPHCKTAQGDVWFEDVTSMAEKAALARQHHLRGVGVYAMGDEPDGFFAAMLADFPKK